MHRTIRHDMRRVRTAALRATARLATALLATALLATASLVPAAALGAQEPRVAPDAAGGAAIAQRVAAAPDGFVHLSYPAREGVCGDGASIRTGDGRSVQWAGRTVREWESECEAGPVRISATVRDGEVTALRSYVGGRWADVDAPITDLGTVAAPAAAAWLLEVAARGPEDAAKRAIFPASLARGVETWPVLLRLARDERRPRAVRQDAVFWVSQAAGEAASRGLNALVDERDADLAVRERAVFALSQRPADEAVPALVRIARTSDSPRLRQRAIFWLGQSKDPRALAFLEEVLLGR